LAAYHAILTEEPFGVVGEGQLADYPRYAASIWDLAARCIAVAMTGKEELPGRPTTPDIPIHHSGSLAYVCFREIPEPTRTFFDRNIDESNRPVVEGETELKGCAYLLDWERFLDGRR